jgi:hypothetical protein
MEAVGGSESEPVDGVISIDAVALQDLVWVIGDVKVEGRHLPLSDRTTTAALEIDTFLGDVPAKAAQLHSDRAFEILSALLERRPGLEAFALATAADSRGRHLSVYLPGRENARLIRSLGLDGRARLKGEGALPVATTWSALGSSHVGALVKASLVQTVTIRPNGSAMVDAEVLFDNGAGTDPPSVLLGRPAGGVPIGTYAADVTLYLPKTANKIEAETSRPSPIRIEQDLGLTTVTGSIAVRGGESTSLTVAYVVPDAVRSVDGAKEVTLRVVPQTTMAGIRYEIRVSLPDGSTILSASAALDRRGDAATFSGVLGGSVDLDLRFGLGQN